MEESIFVSIQSLKAHDHICHIYFNDAECFEIASVFVKSGIKKGKCLYVSDRSFPRELEHRLGEVWGGGVNLQKARKENTFEEIVLPKQRVRGSDSFSATLANRIDKALSRDGKKLVTVLMSNREVYLSYTHSDLMFKKAMLDKFCREKPVVLMNQYDIRKISSVDVLNLFKTHQKIILDRALHESSLYLNPDVIISQMETELNKYDSLTSNEMQVLHHIAGGYSSREVAKEMSISVKTVDKHRANIMKKLNIHKYGDLIKFAIKVGIV